MRLAASNEVVGRIHAQAHPAPPDPVDQLHSAVSRFMAKGFTAEAAAQLVQRQLNTAHHQ